MTSPPARQLKAHFDVLAAGDDATLKVLKSVVDARKGDRDAQMQAARDALLKLMDRVSSLDEDRILRSFMGVIDATLRTSYYQTDANGQHGHVISFKFDSALVPDLPKPRPYREIFVYGPRVEGTHLRFGAVARGGLRWSDRREDFRTEVLGLVRHRWSRTPSSCRSARRAHFSATPPVNGDRDAIFANGVACYKLFIQGLLDITDNIVATRSCCRWMSCHDMDDPYLVVAADKGTATFSDIANGLATRTASGWAMRSPRVARWATTRGQGITARGAWESGRATSAPP